MSYSSSLAFPYVRAAFLNDLFASIHQFLFSQIGALFNELLAFSNIYPSFFN
jgi:hypothetical protein